MRFEDDALRLQAELQATSERLEAELENERERRRVLQGVHEREMTALKSALQKATGFRDPKGGGGSGRESQRESAGGRDSAASEGVRAKSPGAPGAAPPAGRAGTTPRGPSPTTGANTRRA